MNSSSCVIYTRFYHHIHTVNIREYCLCWIQAGNKSLVKDQQRLDCQAGDLLIFMPETQWDMINRPPSGHYYQALNLQFDRELIKSFHQLYGHQLKQPLLNKTTVIKQPLTALLAAMARSHQLLNSQHSDLLKNHQLIEVLLLLAEQGFILPLGREKSWADKVRLLINQEPAKEWSIERLAQQLHTSPSTLRRRIAEHQQTLGELIRETRLEIALVLLQSTDKSIGDISAYCGYESHSRFSAAFKQRFGFLPSDLRADNTLNSFA